MTDDGESHLPPAPSLGTSNGERAYYRRRIDELMDSQLRSLVVTHQELDKRVDGIDAKLNRIFGALAIIVILVNLIAPVVIDWATR